MDWSLVHDLEIVHVGQSGTVLAGAGPTEPVLVPLTFGDRGLVPGGLHVGRSDEADVVRTALALAAHRSQRVDLSAWAPVITTTVDLHLRASTVAHAALDAFATGLGQVRRVPCPPVMDPDPQRRAGRTLAAVVVAGGGSAPIVADLIGAGPGSTPSGDDVVVGVLAGFGVAERGGLLPAAAQDGLHDLRAQVARSCGRTTWAARHDLRAALDGLFCERVHRLAHALGDAALAEQVLVEAAGWGATSGLDLAHGVLAAARVASRRTPTELTRVA